MRLFSNGFIEFNQSSRRGGDESGLNGRTKTAILECVGRDATAAMILHLLNPPLCFNLIQLYNHTLYSIHFNPLYLKLYPDLQPATSLKALQSSL